MKTYSGCARKKSASLVLEAYGPNTKCYLTKTKRDDNK